MQAVAPWLPAIITVVTAIFISGQITGRIKNQETTLVRHDERLNGLDNSVSQLELSAAESKGFRDGLKAGQNLKGGI